MPKFQVCFCNKVFYQEEVEAPTLGDAIRKIQEDRGALDSESYDGSFEDVVWEDTYLANYPKTKLSDIPPALDWTPLQMANLQKELLEACQMVLSASEDGGDMEDIDFEQLRKVVAKATGGRSEQHKLS